MSALAILLIVGCAGLAVASALAAGRAAVAWRVGAAVAIGGSLALAAAGFVAVFSEQLVWRPFYWFGLGRGGVHVDQLAGLFLILTGGVSGAAVPGRLDARAPERRARCARCSFCAWSA